MFSTEHFIWLALCAVLVVAGTILSLKYKLSMEKGLTVICVLCVASEVVKVFSVLIVAPRINDYGYFIKETDLPFHLCSLQIFFAFGAKFTKNKRVRDFLINFMIPTCALGGLAALLIPTITCAFTNVRTYQYFLYHASLIWFTAFAVARAGIKLCFKNYLTMLGTLLSIVFITFYINGALQNTNFLYLSEPPMDGLPILNMNNGWLVYFVSYMGFALALITLFYTPFWIYYAVKSKTETVRKPQETQEI